MIRYDKGELPKKKETEKKEALTNIEKVRLVREDVEKLKHLFVTALQKIEIDNELLVSTVTEELIIMNSNISLDKISKTLKLPDLKSKEDFIRNFLIHNLDELINNVFGKKVIAVKEPNFSLYETDNENLIRYEFIV